MRQKAADWLESLRVYGKPDEWESKKLLNIAGLDTQTGIRVLPDENIDPEDLEFPLVMKVCDPEILHKTEQGGVLLNVSRDNFIESQNKLKKKFPSSPVLVDTMYRIEGPEFILGGLVDPVFGPAVMVGAGGVLTEIYEDAVFRLCPCSKAEALRMLNELRIAPVLNGYRGSSLDIELLADAVSKLSVVFDAFDGKLSQIDINPIVYSGERWVALDCAVILKGV